MKKENILVVVLICIGLGIGYYKYDTRVQEIKDPSVSGGSSVSQKSDGIIWHDYARARELALEQGKHIYIYFNAQWCSACKVLKDTTFKEQAVISYMNDNFINVSIDTEVHKAMTAKWGVRGLPTHWFLKPDGSKIDRLMGYLPKDRFLNALKFIHTEEYKK